MSPKLQRYNAYIASIIAFLLVNMHVRNFNILYVVFYVFNILGVVFTKITIPKFATVNNTINVVFQKKELIKN